MITLTISVWHVVLYFAVGMLFASTVFNASPTMPRNSMNAFSLSAAWPVWLIVAIWSRIAPPDDDE